MYIQLIEDYSEFIPKDSIFKVERETKCYYIVYWSSMFGTYPVKLRKSICIVYTDEMRLVDDKKKEEYHNIVMAHFRQKLKDGDPGAIRLRDMHKNIK